MRLLISLLVLVLAMSVSGISSAMAVSDGDDCCADGAEQDVGGASSDAPAHCPPLCHRCACSPTFALPLPSFVPFVGTIEPTPPRETCVAIPDGPPLRGVFHPPRA